MNKNKIYREKRKSSKKVQAMAYWPYIVVFVS